MLFGARIVDRNTPISDDGRTFIKLGEHPAIWPRLLQVEALLVEGHDPWPDTRDTLVPEAAPGDEVHLDDTPPLAVLFGCALRGSTGVLRVSSLPGTVELSYLDGKIVELNTDNGELSLAAYLITEAAVDARKVEQAVLRAPAMGGDLGGALIALGVLPPHVYLEKLSGWGRWLLAELITWTSGMALLDPVPVFSPPVPLGYDRFGVLVEALKLVPRPFFEAALELRQHLPVIPSHVEGYSLETLKLPPRELRVIKAIDGAKKLSAILEAQKAGGVEQELSALRAIYLATSIGFLVFGEDLEAPKDREQARLLREQLASFRDLSPLEVLGVKPNASDDDVRARYMQLAKEHHPDRVKQNAAPELVDAQRQMFAAIQSAYEAVETAEQRDALKRAADMGYAGVDEQAIVRAALEAETCFKKAEVLFKVKKYAEGLEQLEQALKRKPDDIEFQIHHVYYRLLASKATDDGIRAAITSITNLLKKDPNLASALLILGRLHRQIGDQERSVKCFKKVLDFDPRNHEAASEVRLANLRQQKEKKKWL